MFIILFVVSCTLEKQQPPNNVILSCPSQEQVQSAISKFGGSLVSVQPTKYTGICEVQMKLNNRTHILYISSAGEYFLMGQLYDIQSKLNVTQDRYETINKFSVEEMDQLDKLTAYTLGDSGKVVYYVVDPNCSYCKNGEPSLESLALEKNIILKILYFPLNNESRKIAISTICDKKSVLDYYNGYKSDNQCENGINIINKTREILSRKDVSATPAYIFPDRKYHLGLLSDEELKSRLSLQ